MGDPIPYELSAAVKAFVILNGASLYLSLATLAVSVFGLVTTFSLDDLSGPPKILQYVTLVGVYAISLSGIGAAAAFFVAHLVVFFLPGDKNVAVWIVLVFFICSILIVVASLACIVLEGVLKKTRLLEVGPPTTPTIPYSSGAFRSPKGSLSRRFSV